MIKTTFIPHHVSLSVSNLDKSITFYRLLGFKPFTEWEAEDHSIKIAQLVLYKDYFLELFYYPKNKKTKLVKRGIGNDLDQVGIKHMALIVGDLAKTRRRLKSKGVTDLTEIKEARSLPVHYFFCRDPDGIWVEIISKDH